MSGISHPCGRPYENFGIQFASLGAGGVGGELGSGGVPKPASRGGLGGGPPSVAIVVTLRLRTKISVVGAALHGLLEQARRVRQGSIRVGRLVLDGRHLHRACA